MRRRIILFISFIVFLFCFIHLTSCGLFNTTKETNNKKELTPDMVQIISSFNYTGDEITFSKNDLRIYSDNRYIPFSSFSFVYSNNIEVGVASVIISANEDNEYLYGSITKQFEIMPSTQIVRVEGMGEFLSALGDKNHSRISLSSNITFDEDITIPVSKEVMISNSIIRNNAKITILGSLIILEGTSLYNDGIIDNRGDFSNSGVIYNSGSYINSGNVSKTFGSIYTNNDFDMDTFNHGRIVLRKELKEENVTYSSLNIPFNLDTNQNKLKVYIDNNLLLFGEYEDYDRVGEAKVRFSASENDSLYFGSFELTYNIIKSSITFSSYEELKEYKALKAFNEYTYDKNTYLYILEDFIIDEDETLNVHSLNSDGNFTNNGRLVSTNISLNNGTFINNGEVDIENIYSYNNFTNNNIINSTKISIYSSNNNIEFINNGEMTVGLISSTGMNNINFKNNNKLTINNLNLSTNTSFENKELITINGDSYILGSSFENEGSFINKSRIAFSKDIVVLSVGEIINTGEIFAYSNIFNIPFNLKYDLKDVSVSLDYQEIVYDEEMHKPSFKIDGEAISSDYYNISYYYLDNQGKIQYMKNNIEFISSGERYAEITISDRYYKYDGKITLKYEILKGNKYVSDASSLSTALGNINYANIYLSNDIETHFNINVSNGVNLYTNGYRLVLRGVDLINLGTIYVSDIGDELSIENIGLFLKNGYENNRINNIGNIINDGIIYIESLYDYYSNIQNPTNPIINNNLIFSIDTSKIKVSGDGRLYERKLLNDENIELEYNEILYSGEECTPTLTIKYLDNIIDSSKYNIEYNNNINSGNASVRLNITDIFNEYLYGEKEVGFVIKRNIKNVSLLDELDGLNYERFILSSNIFLSENVEIPKDTCLDLGEYRINALGHTITFKEGATLEVSVRTINDFNNFIHIADKITILSDLGDGSDDIQLNYYNGLSDETYIGINPYKLIIDLNGHSLGAKITISNRDNSSVDRIIDLKFMNSSSNESVIKYDLNNNYSFTQYYDGNTKISELIISLDNITIYGAQFMGGGHSGYNAWTFNISNCKILNNDNTLYALSIGENSYDTSKDVYINISDSIIKSTLGPALRANGGTINISDTEIETTIESSAALYYYQPSYDKDYTQIISNINGCNIKTSYIYGIKVELKESHTSGIYVRRSTIINIEDSIGTLSIENIPNY